MRIKVNSQATLSECIGAIRQEFADHKYLTVNILAGKGRTLSQNAILHAWCSQVSTEECEFTPSDIKCLVKLNIFMPIQRGIDPEYNDLCATVIDVLAYPAKIKAMEIWPVTSLMKTKGLGQGLEAMQAKYAGRVALTFPDD